LFHRTVSKADGAKRDLIRQPARKGNPSHRAFERLADSFYEKITRGPVTPKPVAQKTKPAEVVSFTRAKPLLPE
jgi:hypothetical protein